MFGIIKIFHVFEKKPFQKYQKYNKKVIITTTTNKLFKAVVQINIFMEIVIHFFQDSLMNRKWSKMINKK